MYNIVKWFTDCPYFNLFVSICSVISLLGIIKLNRQPRTKPVMNSSDAEIIIRTLITSTNMEKIKWYSVDKDDCEHLKNINIDGINFNYSYQCLHPNNHKSSLILIIKTQKDIRLYGCLDYSNSSFRLLAINKLNNSLSELLACISKNETLSDKDFAMQMLNDFTNP